MDLKTIAFASSHQNTFRQDKQNVKDTLLPTELRNLPAYDVR